MNRFNLAFTAARLPIDATALALASISAYLLRYSRFATDVRPLLQDIPYQTYIQTSLTFILVWILMFVVAGLYTTRPLRAWNELGRIILACTAGTMILISTIFFNRELAQSRFIILAIWLLSIVYVSFGRTIVRWVRNFLLRKGLGHERIVIIGSDNQTEKLKKIFTDSPIFGFTVVRTIKNWDAEQEKQIKFLINKGKVDGIVLADPDMPKAIALEVINFASSHHLSFRYLADLFAAQFTNIEVSTPGGIPIIEVKRTPLDGWGRITKRFMDLICAMFLIILTSPLWILSALMILIEDGFPIFFKNERIGEKGHKFTTYKFRSMYKKYSIGPQFGNNKKNLEFEKKLIEEKSIKSGPVYKIAGDPRIMKSGRWLRRWSIDELPNFLNVLFGNMSLVGPRPHQPREVENYSDPQLRVLAIKPGVSGLAQISGRSDLTFDEEVKLDSWYIENWSPWLDMYIVLKTPFVVLQKKGAY